MFCRGIFFVLLGWWVSACAQPNYATAEGSSPRGLDQKAGECSLKFSNLGFCVELSKYTKQTDDKPGAFLIKIYRKNADGSRESVDPKANLAVKLWMPMGHGSSPIAVSRVDMETFNAEGIWFSMNGDWQIIFQLKDANNNVVDEAIASVTYPF